MSVAPPAPAPSVSGGVLQPIPGRSPHQTPEFCVHFSLVPPRRVPADGATLIKLHEVAAMKNLRAQSVHLAAALPQPWVWGVFLEERPELFGRARHVVRTVLLALITIN